MSKISLTPNASGTGNFTIASPNSNTDRTLTLPDATGTINTSGAVNEVPAGTASAPSIYPTGDTNTGIFFPAADTIGFTEGGAEAMRIDSSGNVHIAKTATSFGTTGISLRTGVSNDSHFVSDSSNVIAINRLTNDGNLMEFYQATTLEGTISVSGTTVSYNGGHLSRWSQWKNETGKPNVYRGTILESTNDMCEWEKDGEPLPNEQATKTIVSTTVASKAVAGVFDRYDEDDETNPYDFYVAQSGDFVIRIAQGVVVQNGDLLESAGDGTAKPQADDICRSSTVAKVTSNYVSATYEDGSYCVPCILMIG